MPRECSKAWPFPASSISIPAVRSKEKFFEAVYTDRYTANNVIAKLFPELVEQVPRKIEAAHIGLTLQQSDQVVVPGSHLALITEITLGRDLHVYAPGVKGYIPTELKLDPAPEAKQDQVVYPPSKILFLKAIKERVPVFEGKFRITQDVTVSADRTFIKSLGTGKKVSFKGNLNYQACSKTTCYKPASIPVSWEIQVVPLDVQRSSQAIQHRSSQ